MNNNFDTQSLLKEINVIINNGVQDIVKDYIKRYELLEQTHDTIVNLPIVKQYYNSNNSESSSVPLVPIKVEKTEKSEKSEKNEQYVTIDEKMNTLIKQNNELFNKLFTQISELKSEIDLLKQDKKKIEYVDVEKENIKLEFVDIKQEKVVDLVVNESKTDQDDEVEEEEVEEEEVEEVEEEVEEIVEEEEEVEEEEVASVETETKPEQQQEDEAEEDEEELIEIEIDDVTYCTNDEENGSIYELDKEGNVGKKVGYLKDGEAYFDE